MIADYGFKADGTPRQRPVKKREFAILDLDTCDGIEDDSPEHLEWQRVLRARCEEIQAQWSDAEEYKRRNYHADPLTVDELESAD